jgi:CelD/BcsL family acetyltransferase involved in cellulose biosynthesis
MAALERAWCDLFDHSSIATPFQSWAWLYSWWQAYAGDRQLRLIAAWHDEVLVGLVPLMLERRFGIGTLLFVGTGITDHLDMLVKDGYEDAVVVATVDVVLRMTDWTLLDLHQLRPDACAWALARKWRGPRLAVWEDDFPVIPALPLDQLLQGLTQNHRSTLRRTLRRAESDGLEARLAPIWEAEQAGRRLVALHREMWEGRAIGPEHLTHRFLEHMAAAAKRLTTAGLGAVSEFRREGRVIVSSLVLFGRDCVGTCLHGASRDALSQYQVSSLYISDALRHASERSVRYVSLLRGTEAYKLRWKPVIFANRRLILGRGYLTWTPYAAFQFLYSGARRLSHADDAPRLVKQLATAYRKLAGAYRKRKRSP